MKYFFIYNKENGRVVSYSDSLNKVSDKFEQLELLITLEQEEKLKQNYWAWIKEGELVLEKSPMIIGEEKVKKIEEARKKVKDANSLEAIKNLLIEIL